LAVWWLGVLDDLDRITEGDRHQGFDATAFTASFKAEAARWTPLAHSVADQVKAGGR